MKSVPLLVAVPDVGCSLPWAYRSREPHRVLGVPHRVEEVPHRVPCVVLQPNNPLWSSMWGREDGELGRERGEKERRRRERGGERARGGERVGAGGPSTPPALHCRHAKSNAMKTDDFRSFFSFVFFCVQAYGQDAL